MQRGDRAVVAQAGPWVEAVREHPAPFWALDSLLREYPISSAEGLALMRLAEALLRVPDAETAIALTADQLGRADFSGARTGSPSSSPSSSPHRLLAGLSASAIALSKKFLPDGDGPTGLIQRLGAHTVVAATLRAIALLGRQFVLGRSIEEALSQSQRQRTAQASQGGGPLCFSFDMLGEGARTEHDARRYAQAYEQALSQIAAAAQAQTPAAQTAQAAPVEEIVVTGTRVIRDGYVANDETLAILRQQALNQAEAGIEEGFDFQAAEAAAGRNGAALLFAAPDFARADAGVFDGG